MQWCCNAGPSSSAGTLDIMTPRYEHRYAPKRRSVRTMARWESMQPDVEILKLQVARLATFACADETESARPLCMTAVHRRYRFQSTVT